MGKQNSITTFYGNARMRNREVVGNFEIDYANPVEHRSCSDSSGTETMMTFNATANGRPVKYIRTTFSSGWGNNSAVYEYGHIVDRNGRNITGEF